MARFSVFFSTEADEEILKSYEWGVLFWGKDRADVWVRDLYAAVINRLGDFPLSCPFAPESEYLDQEIRQFHFGRYRILFEILGYEVTVIRAVGPYTELRDAENLTLD